MIDAVLSPWASLWGINNWPTEQSHVNNIKRCFRTIIEPARRQFHHTQVLTGTCYVSTELANHLGIPIQHPWCSGECVQFRVHGVPIRQVATWLMRDCEFDQCWVIDEDSDFPQQGWLLVTVTDQNRGLYETQNPLLPPPNKPAPQAQGVTDDYEEDLDYQEDAALVEYGSFDLAELDWMTEQHQTEVAEARRKAQEAMKRMGIKQK